MPFVFLLSSAQLFCNRFYIQSSWTDLDKQWRTVDFLASWSFSLQTLTVFLEILTSPLPHNPNPTVSILAKVMIQSRRKPTNPCLNWNLLLAQL